MDPAQGFAICRHLFVLTGHRAPTSKSLAEKTGIRKGAQRGSPYEHQAQNMTNAIIHYHTGRDDFPHGAGPSEPGWYYYPDGNTSSPPNGPYPTKDAMESAMGIVNHAPKMDATLRIVIEDFERRFKKSRPLCVLARRGAADEQWLIFHPNDLTRPFASVDKDGEGYEHLAHPIRKSAPKRPRDVKR
jgi:hypothetical protein